MPRAGTGLGQGWDPRSPGSGVGAGGERLGRSEAAEQGLRVWVLEYGREAAGRAGEAGVKQVEGTGAQRQVPETQGDCPGQAQQCSLEFTVHSPWLCTASVSTHCIGSSESSWKHGMKTQAHFEKKFETMHT